MDDDLRGFETETIALVVGQDQQDLYIPRGILSQIPYINTVLISMPPHTKTIRMHEYDPKTLADVIYYCWTEAIPELNYDKEREEMRKVVNMRVKAYIVAHKLALDQVQEQIEQQLMLHHQDDYVDPSNLTCLHESGLRGSFLYKLLVAELSHDFVWHDLEVEKYGGKSCHEACKDLPGEVLWDMLREKARCCSTEEKDRPSKQAHWLTSSSVGPGGDKP